MRAKEILPFCLVTANKKGIQTKSLKPVGLFDFGCKASQHPNAQFTSQRLIMDKVIQSSHSFHRRIVWSLIIYCKQTVIESFRKRQKYGVFFRSAPLFVRRREGLHGFGEPLQGAPRRRPVFPVLQHIDDRLVG